MAKRWDSVRLDEIEPIAVVDGTLLWRPVRRTLDIGAFGINAYVAPNAGDDVVEEHTERSLGHEEVYVVLAGRATFTLDDETVDAPAGTVVFIRDVDVKRHARAEEPGTSVLAIGGPRGAAYEPSPWEDYFAPSAIAPPATTTRTRRARGRSRRRPDHPATLYNLACAEALAGRARRRGRRICGVRLELDPGSGSTPRRTRISSRIARAAGLAAVATTA